MIIKLITTLLAARASERGSATVEYSVMIALIAVSVVSAVGALATAFATAIAAVS